MAPFIYRSVFSGLSRQVLLWFLLLSLVPVITVSLISYTSARQQIFDDTSRALNDASKIQSRLISSNISEMIEDLNMEAERSSNTEFLSKLSSALVSSDKPVKEFVRSYRWHTITEGYAYDLTAFWENFGYHDIFLIDQEGNILFTLAQEDDLGENLFTGALAGSGFSVAAKRSLETGQAEFSDLQFYAPTKNELAGFLIAPLLGDSGDKIGLIAFQLSTRQLTEFIGQTSGFGHSGRRYLIGEDLKLRTDNALGEAYSVLDKKVKTENTEKWLAEHVTKSTRTVRNDVTDETFLYTGPYGKRVVGLHKNIDIAGVNWGYIAEIEEEEAFVAVNNLLKLNILLISITALLVFLISLPVTRRIVHPISEIAMALSRVGDGEQNIQLDAAGKNEIGDLARGFNQMIIKLRSSDIETSRNNWLTEGINRLNDCMQGDLMMADLTRNIITFICSYIDAQVGVFYVVEDKLVKATATYATSLDDKRNQKIELGVGLVGQAALDQKMMVISDIPDDYLSITSGLGETKPHTITIVPFMWNSNVVAVLEIGTMVDISELQQRLFEVVSTAIATAIQTAKSRDQTKNLLAQTQTQTEELRVSEEELQDKNSLLERQTEALKKSQMELEESNEKLQTQQEELRIANEELNEKADELKYSRGLLEDKNQSLEEVRVELERRAEELTTSSKYKSEFLSNMSHELRTPLNSLLILAKMLADNKDSNLSEKQVKFSRTIYDSGNDLLSLINDILDLSKIESGKIELEITSIDVDEFSAELQSRFQPVAANKGINFEIDYTQAPDAIKSDDQKLGQILKNFISNAIKFTHSGTVKLRIGPVPEKITLTTAGLDRNNSLAFIVSDTGIGIPEDKKDIIFEAFQQVDGSTSRKYGGTGLGLSISRELTRLLGGEIHLDTKEGKGSSFILIIPTEDYALEQEVSATEPEVTTSITLVDEEAISNVAPAGDKAQGVDEVVVADSVPTPVPVSNVTEQVIADNRNDLSKGDRSILIVEDDPRFAAILADYATERGFKVLVVDDGKTALHFADFYQPSGIILDIGLPGIDGWQVMEVLKSNSATRHIPVHFMSAHSSTMQAMSTGAVGFLTKPVSQEDMEQAFDSIEWVIDRSVKRLLLIEDDPIQSMSLRELIGSGDVETVTADSGMRAMQLLNTETYDCIVLDLGLPDMSGMQLLEDIRSQENLKKIPIIVYTGKELETKERDRLNLFAQDIIIKDVRSPERLLDDTVLFLHRIEENLPPESRETIRMLHDAEALFADQKILVVDDDMRNIFSLCAVLEDKKMQTITAKDGIEALEQLERHPDIKLVLMDIMMPRMDGYEACREIRKQKRFADLPIVALTAKAMKGDRNLCIQAGANDYITKPVIIDKLLSMMRVWLYR